VYKRQDEGDIYDEFPDEISQLDESNLEVDSDYTSDELDLDAYTIMIQFIEDWIFDKNTSSLRYEMRYFQLIWVDPGGVLPDKVMAVFRWEDIKPILSETQWPNRFNDAENHSVTEVFDMRIFNSFLIDVSGQGMRSLDEAERWRLKMVEKEHNLYSY